MDFSGFLCRDAADSSWSGYDSVLRSRCHAWFRILPENACRVPESHVLCSAGAGYHGHRRLLLLQLSGTVSLPLLCQWRGGNAGRQIPHQRHSPICRGHPFPGL